jgi:flagellar biosynthesis protein FlhA
VTVQTAASPAFSGRLVRILGNSDAGLAIAVMVVIAMMVTPLPPTVIDLFITLSLGVSITILLIAMYVEEPLQFSVFPSLLLIVTLFRLGLNISSSRSILLNGYAGRVIEAFGSFVVGGNYVVGLVVFLLLMIIQFTVITNGAGRVAEVAARFTLDAMPGKQMSIDADLNAGLLTEEEARRRRRMVETEADFYGAMDGASKFVKGDAIAGVAIVLVNIVGGFVIGVVQRGMSLSEALQTYTLLTVGDGLVAQIPALLVSTATGIIVTRAASEASMGSDVFRQLFGNPRVLITVGGILLAFGLIPGLPKLPFLALGGVIAAISYLQQRRSASRPPEPVSAPPAKTSDNTEEVFSLIKVDPITVELGYALIPLVEDEGGLLERIAAVRRQIAMELGLVLPKIRIRDNLRLPPNTYQFKLRGEPVAQGELVVNRLLAMPGSSTPGEGVELSGMETREPVFGLPALWIEKSQKERAELYGFTIVDPASVMTTHLAEVMRHHAFELLTRDEVQKLLDHLAPDAATLVQEVKGEGIGLNMVQRVLQNLLRERVPIRDLVTILEVIASKGYEVRDPDVLTEYVRQALGRAISNQYREEDGILYVATLGPEAEQRLAAAVTTSDQGLMVHLDPELGQRLLNRLATAMEQMAQSGHQPVLICSSRVRLPLSRFVQRSLPQLSVLSYSEVPAGIEVYACSMVEVDGEHEGVPQS